MNMHYFSCSQQSNSLAIDHHAQWDLTSARLPQYYYDTNFPSLAFLRTLPDLVRATSQL